MLVHFRKRISGDLINQINRRVGQINRKKVSSQRITNIIQSDKINDFKGVLPNHLINQVNNKLVLFWNGTDTRTNRRAIF